MMKKQVVYLVLVVVILGGMTAAAYMAAPGSSDDNAEAEGTKKVVDQTKGDNLTPTNGSCEFVTCQEGNSGTISIPIVGVNLVETDMKHHWSMPDGKVKVTATLTWSAGWELEFSIGLGECPHSGTKLAGEASSSGSITIEYEADTDGTLETGQWFAHVATPDPNQYRGQSCDYQFVIELCSGETTECDEC